MAGSSPATGCKNKNMTEHLEIRPYREPDLGAVVDLWQACGLVRPWNPPAGDIATVRASGHGELLVAAAEGRVVGSVMVGHDGHRGWVYYMAVDPARQRHGIGALLLRAAEDWVAARGIRKLELMIRDSNVAVAAFYESCGYAREPVVVMSRWLREQG
jgi:ribosomal protein S18 acetylase RimI-like enzyme